jgi:hypothetical protein
VKRAGAAFLRERMAEEDEWVVVQKAMEKRPQKRKKMSVVENTAWLF